MIPVTDNRKVVLIGTGMVGMSYAYARFSYENPRRGICGLRHC